MVHARNVKPPVAGAIVIGIDESSVQNLPGFIRAVSKGNYVAVVCERAGHQRVETARGHLAAAAAAAVSDFGSALVPNVTTAEMRTRTGNPEFQYEIACAQLCGLGHFRMRGYVTVQTAEEFQKWMEEKVKEQSEPDPFR